MADENAPDPEVLARIEELKAKIETDEELTEEDEAFLEEVAGDPRYPVGKNE
jgi:hypothetical protein